MNFKDLTGKRFGKLLVIKRRYPNNNRGRAMWLCKCECGNTKTIRSDKLLSGTTQDCGCVHHGGIKLKPSIASMRLRIRGYKRSAKARGLEYTLTEQQFAEITHQNCYYCGAKPNNISKQSQYNGEYVYNGLDRVDNSRGYTIDNVVPCCKFCNERKGKLSLQEFKDWINSVYKNLSNIDKSGIIKV